MKKLFSALLVIAAGMSQASFAAQNVLNCTVSKDVSSRMANIETIRVEIASDRAFVTVNGKTETRELSNDGRYMLAEIPVDWGTRANVYYLETAKNQGYFLSYYFRCDSARDEEHGCMTGYEESLRSSERIDCK